MKYRIVTDEKLFRVQARPRWWPFWLWVTRPNEGGGESILQFETLEEAQKYISREEDAVKYVSWRVVG